MYVCMYVRMYVYMYVCKYVCVYVCMYVCAVEFYACLQRRTEIESISKKMFRRICLSVCIYISSYSPLVDLGSFFSFLIFYTVGRTPWTGDQPVAKPLSAHRTAKHRINAQKY
jgi:hypothetical protein